MGNVVQGPREDRNGGSTESNACKCLYKLTHASVALGGIERIYLDPALFFIMTFTALAWIFLKVL